MFLNSTFFRFFPCFLRLCRCPSAHQRRQRGGGVAGRIAQDGIQQERQNAPGFPAGRHAERRQMTAVQGKLLQRDRIVRVSRAAHRIGKPCRNGGIPLPDSQRRQGILPQPGAQTPRRLGKRPQVCSQSISGLSFGR